MLQNFGEAIVQHGFDDLSMFTALCSQCSQECTIDTPVRDQQCPFVLLHGINYILGYGFMQCSMPMDILHTVCFTLPGSFIEVPTFYVFLELVRRGM